MDNDSWTRVHGPGTISMVSMRTETEAVYRHEASWKDGRRTILSVSPAAPQASAGR